jgi:hypothetical protein
MKDDDYMTTFIEEHCDDDTITLIREMIPYELIHRLLKENLRLCNSIADTRKEMNSFLQGGNDPIPALPSENLFCGVCDDHPAMERYIELYGEHAVVQR